MDKNPIAVGIPKPISSMSHRESLRAKADAEDSKGNRKSSRRLSTSSRHRSKSRDSDGLSPSEKAPHRRKSTNGSRHRSRSRDSDGLSPLNSSKHRSKSRDSDGLSQSERAPHRHKSIDGSRHRSRSRDDDGLSRSERAPHRRKSNDDGLALAPGSSSRKLDEKAAYRRRSNDGAALVPGAQAEKSSSRKSDEKAAYRRRSNDGPALVPGAQAEKSSSRKSDEKAAFRRRSNDGPALVPGAQAEKSSSRKSDEKAKERRSTRAIKPGAESATASQDKSKSKSSRRLSNDRDINVEGLGKTTEEGETVVAAMIVEDEDEAEAKRVQRDKARMEAMEAMVAANAERERQRMEAENERLRKAMELAEAERKAKKKKKRKMTICVLLFCLAIGAIAVAAFLALQGRSSSDAVKQTSGQEDETTDPSPSPSELPSIHPSSDRSNSPTLPLKYERPSEEECEQVAAGLPLEGEENMDIKSFDIRIDIDLLGESDILIYVLLLQSMIEEHIIPDLIGCPQDRNATELPLYDLTLESIRYAVAKSSISVDVMEGESCRDTESPTCTALMATITTTVREQEKIFRLISILSAFFRAGENIQQYLQLQDPFNSVTVVSIQSNDPTTAPTIAPTGTTSEDPTMLPTSRPSTRPTAAPAIGPTTPAPTKAPTKAPSKAPTPLPTLAPTATPPPTAAPQPGLTPPPTRTPTKVPSMSPTLRPSSLPSVMLSSTPSIEVSAAPSPAPTSGPTSGPTLRPTTQAPTSIYLGCFQDDANRVFDIMPGGYFSVDGCRTFCRDLGYPYSALQIGYVCSCGNQYDSLGTSNNCNDACIVNHAGDQYCGGPWANSVYMSGAPLTSPVPALESNLYCGCAGDLLGGGPRDLPHQAPYQILSQVGCIHYCKSKGYNFAALQYVDECYCGNAAGSYGTSLNCFFVDKNRDGVIDKCYYSGVGACYGNSNSCECGGANANTLFRTNQAVSCPASIPPTQNYMGCMFDELTEINHRDLSVMGTGSASIANCRNICKDIGFVYSAIQNGQACFCGNSYGKFGGSGSCTMSCAVNPSESGCGNSWVNSVYWSGAPVIAPVADLEDNLYCGCTRDTVQQRDLEHEAPYANLGQKACIHYCRTKGYDFAALQFQSSCFCGNNPGTYSFSETCNMSCYLQEATNCYDGSSSCTCGGAGANDLFRTTTSVSCPQVTAESYTHKGCFRDDFYNRVMGSIIQFNHGVPSCVALCRGMGFAYAGLQFGGECYCGNQYATLGISNNCYMVCAADGLGVCGGELANSVYAT